MAKPPPDTTFKKTDFPSNGLGSQDALDRFFTQLNAFTQATRANLNGGLSGQNFNSEYKTFTLKTPTSSTGAYANGYPYADYYCSSAQTIVNNAATVVNFDKKVTDTDGAATTGSGWRWTCPAGKGGVYQVSTQVDLNSASAAGTFFSALYKNGAEYRRFGRAPGVATVSAAMGCINVSLAAGDYIDVRAFQNSGSNQPLEAGASVSNWVTIQALNLASSPVMSCFPALVKPSTITKPVYVAVAGIFDTATPRASTALAGVDWNLTSSGIISVNNIAGLALGRTYTVTLYIAGQ